MAVRVRGGERGLRRLGDAVDILHHHSARRDEGGRVVRRDRGGLGLFRARLGHPDMGEMGLAGARRAGQRDCDKIAQCCMLGDIYEL